MSSATDVPEGNPDYQAFCPFSRERVCGGDCVLFDSNGARDTTGKLTSCRLANDVAGIRAALVTVGTYFREKRSESLPGSDTPVPGVMGG